eukprot:TRINITY_DN989_c0_g1_i1.p1 TRINITY_DN989_c0_g1~~TRINITY_DN989_c0_g1_i1.p1  ORF type:complete len:418 (+),score=53.48 TRINITY_DN989_c0_g1_i1:746-1999(+)
MCSNFGVPQPSNICTRPDGCMIELMTCDDLPVDPAVWDGDLRQCRILKLFCGRDAEFVFEEFGGAKVDMLSCGSDLVRPSQSADANLQNCQISRLVYQDVVLLLGDDEGSAVCVRDELWCNGEKINDVSKYDGDWRSCETRQKSCKISQPSCEAISLNCTLDGDCFFTDRSCADTCWSSTYCTCPSDRRGNHCQEQRPFSCQLLLESPVPECRWDRKGDEILDGDPVCISVKTKDTVKFKYVVDCQFTDDDRNEPIDLDYKYRCTNDKNNFAISAPKEVNDDDLLWIRYKYYDMNRIASNKFVTATGLSKTELCGLDSVSWSLNVATVPKKLISGGRIYMEVSLHNGHAIDNFHVSPPDKRFIDIENYAPDGMSLFARSAWDVIFKVALAVTVVVVFAGSVLSWYKHKISIDRPHVE